MLLLAIGVVIWFAVHLMPALAPDAKAALVARLGAPRYRALFALTISGAMFMMIFGYRAADWIPVYDPPVWAMHANNLLMLVALYLFTIAEMKRRKAVWLATKLRHPMLAGALLWAVAHLIANGDQASVLLFGGLGVWALVEMAAISRRDGAWTPPAPAGAAAEAVAIVATLVALVVIIFIHGWIFNVPPVPM